MKFKFFRTLIINTLVAAFVGALFVLGGCKEDDEPGVPPPTQTILEIVDADPDLSELADYIAAFPDLETLLGAPGTTTLFAPNNAAFDGLYATPGFPADPADISLDLIKGVIAYHIVASQILAADLTPTGSGAGIATLFNQPETCNPTSTTNQVIKVNDDGTLKTGSTTTNIEILESDIKATNGVVHITKSVLIPPSVGATLTPILGKLAATVLLGADFKYLAQAMTKADCGVAGVTPISNILADPSGATYTAFLPPDVVFQGTAAAQSKTVQQFIDGFTAAQWRNIILNHIATGTVSLSQLADGTSVVTLLGPPNTKINVAAGTPGDPTVDPTKSPVGKYLATTGGTTGFGGTTGSPIYQGDIAASNGVAHVIGKILIPN